jgi:hypothetical protein
LDASHTEHPKLMVVGHILGDPLLSNFFKSLLNYVIDNSNKCCKNKVDVLGKEVREVPSLAIL